MTSASSAWADDEANVAAKACEHRLRGETHPIGFLFQFLFVCAVAGNKEANAGKAPGDHSCCVQKILDPFHLVKAGKDDNHL